MHDNHLLIDTFYSAFSRRDWKTMQECYHEDAVFFDPVFRNLNAVEVRAMWQMLVSRATDLKIDYHSIQAEEEYGNCNWIAHYTFSKTGRPVTNHIRAHFKFHEGKFIEHMDDFSMWKWSRQALGFPGLLLGWSSIIRNKVHREAKRNLEKFMAKTANQ